MLGEQIRKARVDQGLTQEELAEKSGITLKTIHLLETGKNLNPTRFVLCSISSALNNTKFDIYWHEALEISISDRIKNETTRKQAASPAGQQP